MSQAIDTRNTAGWLPLFPDHGPQPDHELFRLGAELEEAWATERTAMELAPAGDLFDETMLAAGVIVDRIAEISAGTLPGLLIKARALSWCFSGQPVGHEGDGVEAVLSNSILRGLVRMAEARK